MTPSTPTDFNSLVVFFLEFIELLIVLVFAVTFIVIIWKVIDAWIIHADNEDKRAEGQSVALTGVLVLVVMAGIWGILALLQSTL